MTLSGTTLYGMTSSGGATRVGNAFSVSTSGTNYQNLIAFAPGFDNEGGQTAAKIGRQRRVPLLELAVALAFTVCIALRIPQPTPS